MKKLIMCTFAAIAAMTFVGCGNPKIPANTVAAGYADLSKSVDNVTDIAKLIVSNLPKELKEEAEKQLDEALDQYKKNLKPFDLDWALAVVCKGSSPMDIQPGFIVKCKYNEKTEMGTLKDVLVSTVMPMAKADTKWGCDVLLSHDISVAFVNDKFVVGSPDKDLLEKLVALYKDGKGDTSDAFDGLTDLGGNAVVRFQTADVASIVDMFGVRGILENYGKECDDEDLVEDILDIGNITLDIAVSDDTLGYTLTVEAGSKEFARCIEGLALVGRLSSRFFADAVAGFGKNLKDLPLPYGMDDMVQGVGEVDGETCKKLAKMLRGAIEVDRSGSTVEVACELDTEDLVELIVPAVTKK